MKIEIRELPRAVADKRENARWIAERSPQGATAWLAAYEVLMERLAERADTFGEAHENVDLKIDVREALFKTRRGRPYRVLFTIEGAVVYVLRILGPGLPLVGPDDLR
jgi:hypothetical protein